jgi:hypothetical protein
MRQQNNTPKNLGKKLLKNKITLEQYFFRLQANQMNIKTFKYTDNE